MSSTLNRVGIALNFVAGILLAPHLIGEERLESLASQIGQYLHERRWAQRWGIVEPPDVVEGRREAAARRAARIAELERRGRSADFLAPAPGEPGHASSRYSAWYVLGLAPVWVAAMLALQYLRTGGIDADDDWWPSALILVGIGVAVFAGAVVVTVVLSVTEAGSRRRDDPERVLFVATAFAFPVVLALLVLSVPVLLVKATGDRRWLITAMTSVGIAAFTAGTALQFWATYED